jgi:hypothetical protein
MTLYKVDVSISIGELFDKYSILQIKLEKINNTNKLIYVKKEIEYLQPHINKFNVDKSLLESIKNINEKLWVIEDKIREKEIKKEFDDGFISLARQVYITNDERCNIKNKINLYCNSEIKEIKSYDNINIIEKPVRIGVDVINTITSPDRDIRNTPPIPKNNVSTWSDKTDF